MSEKSPASKLVSAARRVDELVKTAGGGSGGVEAALPDVLEEAQDTLHELVIAEERLRLRNEELSATLRVLETKEAHYQELFDFAPEGYLVTAPDGMIEEVNLAVASLFGAPKDHLVGKPLVSYVSEADRREFLAHLKRIPELGRGDGWELRLQPSNGGPFPVALTVKAARQHRDQSVVLRWFIRDITERKQAEEALRESHSLLNAIIEQTSDAIAVTDVKGRYMFVNAAGARWLGRSLDEVVGRDDTALFPPDAAQKVMAQDRSVLEDGQTRQFENTVAVEETNRTYLVNKTAYLDNRGNVVGLIGIARDITVRKQIEDSLRLKTDQLATVTDAMTAFVESGNWREASARILRSALSQTGSEYGFVGVVTEGPALRILAQEGIKWDDRVGRKLYEEALRTYERRGYLEFTNFENLFGKVITGRRAVISNNPATDPRSAGRPPGHPPLRHFLGVPIFAGAEVVGIIGLANRPGGYTGTEQDKIEILCRAAGVLYDSYRRRQHEDALELKRKEADEALQQVVEGTSSTVGEDFQRSLVRHLAAALRVQFSFVSERHPSVTTRLRLLALWERTDFGEVFDYDVRGTPCEYVFAKKLAYFPANVRNQFPKDRWLQEKGIESYLAIPLFDSTGNPIGHLGVMHDNPMTEELPNEAILRIFAARAGAEIERRRAEETLLESERVSRERLAQLELLYDASPLGLCYMDTKLRYLRCNAKLAELNGIPAADHLGRTFREIVPEIAESMESVYQKVIESGEAMIDIVATGVTAADPQSVHHFSACYYPIKSEDGVVTGVSLIVQDITERKRAEEALRKAHDELEIRVRERTVELMKANENLKNEIADRQQAEERTRQREAELTHFARLSTMGEMAAGFAHELNQPLSAIMNFSDACRRRLLSDCDATAELSHSLARITSMAERAGQIISRLKDLARKREPNRSTVDVNELVREAASLVASEARLGSVELRLELRDQLPPLIVDRIQIQQVVLNLLRNGIEATVGGETGPRLVVVRTLRCEAGPVDVTIADTGPGLAPEVADRIFEAFVTTKPQGLGMGLSISRSIITAHGGRLWVEPNPGRGVTFRFTLPVGGGNLKDRG